MSHSLLSPAVKKDKILVVDDSPDNLFLIDSILQEEGHEIVLADNGFKALDLIETSPPHLILLDVMMPEMDGFEVTRRIRENKDLPFIPILLITAYDYPSAAIGLDSGADDFIRKPVEIEELLARVRSLLRLKHSVDERDEIARQRKDFVSRLTHDLRTPLVAADRMLMLLQQGALGELSVQIREAIETMARSNRNLLEMVNNLLEVYRYEADRKLLNFSEVDLHNLIQEIVQELSPLAEEKGLKFDYQLQINPSPMIKGDRLELHRVFTNLINNGIKFTDQGSIIIKLNKHIDVNNSEVVWVEFTIEDTGSGISSEDQQFLFERFHAGNHHRSGSGLGLHLSRRIVESHHGRIILESELGQGSKFTVYLPWV
jgi:two-component system, sensor histidine kinase and response regulator